MTKRTVAAVPTHATLALYGRFVTLAPFYTGAEGDGKNGDATTDGTPPADASKTPEGQPNGDEGKTGEKPPASKTGTEGTGAEGKPKGTSEEQPPAGAPEKYTLQIPDAAKDRIPSQALEAFEASARTRNLTNEQAQAELGAVLATDALVRDALRTQWKTQVEQDAELGGERLAETQRLGNLAIDKLFPEGDEHRDATLAFLKEGAGDHPVAVRLLHRIGRLMAEDAPVSGRAKSGTGSIADAMYDHPTSQALNKR